jgi:hypothetical protein
MKSMLFAIVFVGGLLAVAQNPPSTAPSTPHQQENASSATKDNSGISGDQVTKPAGAKGSTLIGCLAGPDPDGKYVLRSMQHRTGVSVLGPEDLKNAGGKKVKLTGSWQSGAQPNGTAAKASARPFQATSVEVVSESCQPPSTTSPSKKKN